MVLKMNEKGIATIIAAIILLIITISLAGTAYAFINLILKGRISKSISMLGSSCNGTHVTIVIANEGTDVINGTELKVLINGQPANPPDFGADVTIEPHSSAVKTFAGVQANKPNQIIVTSPSNSVDFTVWC